MYSELADIMWVYVYINIKRNTWLAKNKNKSKITAVLIKSWIENAEPLSCSSSVLQPTK